MTNLDLPIVTIGVPVYNGEATLPTVLNSLINQTFKDIEIIISDNASTDDTKKICELAASQDSRISYVRQSQNIGGANNFNFVLNQSRGRYFMWAAADDLRSLDYVEQNVNFLEKNLNYVASTCPNCFDTNLKNIIRFSLTGNIRNRLDTFINNCWVSQGIFYSLIRTDILKKYEHHGEHYLAADWSLDIYLITEGEINRTQNGLMTSSTTGISSNNPWRPFRSHIIYWILPLYKFSLYTLKMTNNQPLFWRVKLVIKLLKLNLFSAKSQLFAEIYPFYHSYIKPIFKNQKKRAMSLFSKVSLRLRRFIESANTPTLTLAEQQLILQAQLIAEKNKEKTTTKELRDIEFKAFSQWGEDGIIDWLVNLIPSINPSFVEFGVSDYRESNTRLLLQSKNWRGLIIDGSEENISAIKSQEIYWKYDIEAKQAFITTENINTLISESGFQNDIGLLSVDIDGNDYWVWEAITTINPAIVICEYNTAFGDIYPLTIPYQPDFQRKEAHHSLLYFGASIQALISLGKEKGYTCIGTTSSGCNAFFIRNDLAHHVLDSIEKTSIYPCKAREARSETGEMLYIDGIKGADMISHLPVIDITDKHPIEDMKLSSKNNLFSQEWLSGEGVNLENSI